MMKKLRISTLNSLFHGVGSLLDPICQVSWGILSVWLEGRVWNSYSFTWSVVTVGLALYKLSEGMLLAAISFWGFLYNSHYLKILMESASISMQSWYFPCWEVLATYFLWKVDSYLSCMFLPEWALVVSLQEICQLHLSYRSTDVYDDISFSRLPFLFASPLSFSYGLWAWSSYWPLKVRRLSYWCLWSGFPPVLCSSPFLIVSFLWVWFSPILREEFR